MGNIKLYSYFRSSAAYRVRIALNLKNIAYETLAIHLAKDGGENWNPEYLRINPQGFVPALVDNNKTVDKNKTLIQSLAIIEYIEEKFQTPSLMPDALQDRAFCRGLAQIICSDIHPLNNLRILKYLKDEFSCSQTAVDTWYCHWINEGFKAFETLLAQRPKQTTYCCTDQPGLADLCLIPQLYNAKRFDCDLSHYPIINQIDDACNQLNAFKQAAPEAQPDAE